MRVQTTVGVAVVAALVSAGALPAHATQTPDHDPIAAIAAAAPEVLQNRSDITPDAFGDEAIQAVENGSHITIPTDAADGITLGTADGVIGIGLPNAEHADPAVSEMAGVVSYDNGDGSTTVPVVKDDGSIQINTIIADEAAPTRYEYPLDIPEGATVEEIGPQMFAVLTAEGEPLTVVLPPWAKDATGADVPTRYAIESGALVQYVDHNHSEVSYPVVADPQFAWYGVLPSIKTTRGETKTLRSAATPGGLAACTKMGASVGLAIGVLCAVNAASIAWNAGLAYNSGKCSQLLIGPGVIGTVAYKDNYCR